MQFNKKYEELIEDLDTLDQLQNLGFDISDAIDAEIEARGITDKLDEIVFYRQALVNLSKYVPKERQEQAINDIKSINN